MDLKVEYDGQEHTVAEGQTAVIGADVGATVPVSKPGISRRHAIVRHDGNHWVVEDASSRNGTFHSGSRIQFLDIDGATTIKLGHPTEGPEIVLTPADAAAETRVATRVAPLARPVGSNAASGSEKPVIDRRLDDLIEALNDSASSVKGLTWSVWAMIAVTAALVVLTLFVAIVGNGS
ncbi:MAG: FHA domain-containing protein [Acidobacteria bacterium]|nr:FHA domain-containing protein [Acidobacteriota bacterium]